MNNGFAINPPTPLPFSSPTLVLYDCFVQTLVLDNEPLSALPASVHWPLHYFLINAHTKSSVVKGVLVALVCCEATQSNLVLSLALSLSLQDLNWDVCLHVFVMKTRLNEN